MHQGPGCSSTKAPGKWILKPSAASALRKSYLLIFTVKI